MVSVYTGLSFKEIDDLDYLDYLLYRRDAFITQCRKTEEGREYLQNAWRIGQTKPDRKALREKYGKGV